MKRILIGLAIILSIGLLATSCKDRKGTNQNDTNMTENTVFEPEFDIITNFGTMRIKLYDKTPLHRENFIKLVNDCYPLADELKIETDSAFCQGIFVPFGITEDDDTDGVRNGGFGSTGK